MFFYFLKIIFNISTSKRSKKYKPHSILAKKKNQNLAKRTTKQSLKQKIFYKTTITVIPNEFLITLEKKKNSVFCVVI
jgi:hypothetical protein